MTRTATLPKLAETLEAYERVCAETHNAFIDKPAIARVNARLWPLVDAARACGMTESVTGVVAWAKAFLAAQTERAA